MKSMRTAVVARERWAPLWTSRNQKKKNEEEEVIFRRVGEGQEVQIKGTPEVVDEPQVDYACMEEREEDYEETMEVASYDCVNTLTSTERESQVLDVRLTT